MSVSALETEHPVGGPLKDAVIPILMTGRSTGGCSRQKQCEDDHSGEDKQIQAWACSIVEAKMSHGSSSLRDHLHIPHQEIGGLGMTWWLLKGFPDLPDSALFSYSKRSWLFSYRKQEHDSYFSCSIFYVRGAK